MRLGVYKKGWEGGGKGGGGMEMKMKMEMEIFQVEGSGTRLARKTRRRDISLVCSSRLIRSHPALPTYPFCYRRHASGFETRGHARERGRSVVAANRCCSCCTCCCRCCCWVSMAAAVQIVFHIVAVRRGDLDACESES